MRKKWRCVGIGQEGEVEGWGVISFMIAEEKKRGSPLGDLAAEQTALAWNESCLQQ